MDKNELVAILDPVISAKFLVFELDNDNQLSIKQIVEQEGLELKYGNAYYQYKVKTTKKGEERGEIISLSKKVIVIDIESKHVFLDEEGRSIIGTHETVETAKMQFIPTESIRKNYLIFIQSRSSKRIPKSCFLIYIINNQ